MNGSSLKRFRKEYSNHTKLAEEIFVCTLKGGCTNQVSAFPFGLASDIAVRQNNDKHYLTSARPKVEILNEQKIPRLSMLQRKSEYFRYFDASMNESTKSRFFFSSSHIKKKNKESGKINFHFIVNYSFCIEFKNTFIFNLSEYKENYSAVAVIFFSLRSQGIFQCICRFLSGPPHTITKEARSVCFF